MKKESIYLDTSISSAYFDSRIKERQEATIRFWKEILPHYIVYISELVVEELENIKDEKLKNDLMNLIRPFEILKVNPEVEELAREYIKNKLLPEKYINDALHIAIGSCNSISYIVSWNFEHIVKVKTRRIVNLVNTLQGYKEIEIISPKEL